MVLRTSLSAPLSPSLVKRVMTSLKPMPSPRSPSLNLLLLRRKRLPRKRRPLPRRKSLSLQPPPAVGVPGEQKSGAGDAQTSPAKAPEHPSKGDRPKFFASPLARKIALENGIPLAEIKGTGPNGRIVEVGLPLAFLE